MDYLYKNIEEYKPIKKRKILIAFNYRIADTLNNKRLNPIVTELSIRDRKLNIFLVFIMQSHFAVPKNIRLNSTHYFNMKIPNKKSLNKLHLIIHGIQDFASLYKNVVQNHILFLVIDVTLASDNA